MIGRIVYAAVSLVCFAWTFPTMLFLCYPYVLIGDAVFLTAVVIASVLGFKKTASHPLVWQRIWAVLLCLPLLLMAAVLIALGAGWIHVG